MLGRSMAACLEVQLSFSVTWISSVKFGGCFQWGSGVSPEIMAILLPLFLV